MSENCYQFAPCYVLRVAGCDSGLVNDIRATSLEAHLQEIDHLESQAASKSQEVVSGLETKVKGNQNKDQVRLLLKAKRNFYNLKCVADQDLVVLLGYLERDFFDSELASMAQDLNALLVRIGDLWNALPSVYESYLENSREALYGTWEQPLFQLGVSYTSAKIYDDITRLVNGEITKHKKRRVIEDSMLQYMLRVSTKTSPLSTFTVLSPQTWGENDSTHVTALSVKADCMATQVRNFVEIKRACIDEAADVFLAQFHNVREAGMFLLNPTVRVNGEDIVFRKRNLEGISEGKAWSATETSYNLKMNTFLKCLFLIFSKVQGSALSYDKLLQSLQSISASISADVAYEYLAKLYDLGLLVLKRDIDEQGTLWAPFNNLRPHLSTETERKIDDMMKYSDALIEQFSVGAPEARASINTQIGEQVNGIQQLLAGETYQTHTAGKNFYETSYIDSSPIAEKMISQYAVEFQTLLELSPLTDHSHLSQSQFADYFVAKFGEEGEVDNVAELVAQFDEIYGPAKFGHIKNEDKEVEPSATGVQYAQALVAYENFIAEAMLSTADEVELDLAQLQAIVDRIPASIRARSVSNSYLVQAFTESDNTRFVLNQVFSGRLGLMSRYLDDLSAEQLQSCKDYLNSSSDSERRVEVPGVFGFNANRHPELLDSELVVPGYPCNRSQANKLHLHTLRARYNKRTHKVDFIDSEGRVIDLWYLGFLLPSLLPPVHRTFITLNYDSASMPVFQVVMKKQLIKQGEPTRFPRLKCGGVVLSRWSIVFPPELLPSPSLDNFTFFKAMKNIQRQYSIPDEVFVRIAPVDLEVMLGTSKDIDWENFSFKDVKPFYVDFNNPRLVRLLLRALKRGAYPVTMTEVLPALNDQCVSSAHSRNGHVSEIHFELSKSSTHFNPKQAERD